MLVTDGGGAGAEAAGAGPEDLPRRRHVQPRGSSLKPCPGGWISGRVCVCLRPRGMFCCCCCCGGGCFCCCLGQ